MPTIWIETDEDKRDGLSPTVRTRSATFLARDSYQAILRSIMIPDSAYPHLVIVSLLRVIWIKLLPSVGREPTARVSLKPPINSLRRGCHPLAVVYTGAGAGAGATTGCWGAELDIELSDFAVSFCSATSRL